jgi:hypothetical protein
VIFFWDVVPCSFVESVCSFMALCGELIAVPPLAVICRWYCSDVGLLVTSSYGTDRIVCCLLWPTLLVYTGTIKLRSHFSTVLPPTTSQKWRGEAGSSSQILYLFTVVSPSSHQYSVNSYINYTLEIPLLLNKNLHFLGYDAVSC